MPPRAAAAHNRAAHSFSCAHMPAASLSVLIFRSSLRRLTAQVRAMNALYRGNAALKKISRSGASYKRASVAA